VSESRRAPQPLTVEDGREKKQPSNYTVIREFAGGPGSERNLIEVQLMLIRGPEKSRRRLDEKRGGNR
jgi:hypothetical protein